MALDPLRVCVITDPGRDIDDTLALHVIASACRNGTRMDLVGVISSGGACLLRAVLARGLLRSLGLPDTIPVAACPEVDGVGRHEVFVPDELQSLRAQSARLHDCAVQLLLDLSARYPGELIIVGIGPLTPLRLAIETSGGIELLRGIRGLYIQGQAFLQEGKLRPDFAAFNLREDRRAAELVFEHLQQHVPFTLLGKHAAYRVALTKDDLVGFPPSLELQVKGQTDRAYTSRQTELTHRVLAALLH